MAVIKSIIDPFIDVCLCVGTPARVTGRGRLSRGPWSEREHVVDRVDAKRTAGLNPSYLLSQHRDVLIRRFLDPSYPHPFVLPESGLNPPMFKRH